MKKYSLIIGFTVCVSLFSFCNLLSENYEEVKIGNQVWMKKNLDVDKFSNGDTIYQAKNLQDLYACNEGNIPAWFYYEFNSVIGAKYGKLYNWYAVDDKRGLAPKGWKIPSLNDWNLLIENLKKESYNQISKENNDDYKRFLITDEEFYQIQLSRAIISSTRINDSIWIGQDHRIIAGNNKSGFSALPDKYPVGDNSSWWTTTMDSVGNTITGKFEPNGEHIIFNIGGYDGGDEASEIGYAVRCIKK